MMKRASAYWLLTSGCVTKNFQVYLYSFLSIAQDDAGLFISRSIGKIKRLETGNRAIFAECLKNQVSWFRPYVNGDGL